MKRRVLCNWSPIDFFIIFGETFIARVRMMYMDATGVRVCVRWGETSVLETRMRRVCSDVLTSVYAWNDVIIGRSMYRACVGYGRMGAFYVVCVVSCVGSSWTRTRSVGRGRSDGGGRPTVVSAGVASRWDDASAAWSSMARASAFQNARTFIFLANRTFTGRPLVRHRSTTVWPKVSAEARSTSTRSSVYSKDGWKSWGS